MAKSMTWSLEYLEIFGAKCFTRLEEVHTSILIRKRQVPPATQASFPGYHPMDHPAGVYLIVMAILTTKVMINHWETICLHLHHHHHHHPHPHPHPINYHQL